MTNEQFDQLVNRIQTRYGSRPWALRWRIALVVALGYSGFLAVLLAVIMLSVALMFGAILADKEPSVVLVAIVALLLAFGVCQALALLWVPIKPPTEREVTRQEAPQLFQLLDRLRTEVRARRFDHVRLTSELNAGVQVIPRWGVFGFNRSELHLGLPLMRLLSPEQFSAVLAHEFAHLSSRHDRFGMWIYRLHQTWARVFAELADHQSRGFFQRFRRPINWFIGWYWPRFNAYSFVLMRANEYEADRMAANWAGTAATAEALFRIECVASRLNEKFWPDLKQQAKREDAVANDILHRIETFLDSEPEPADATRWLDQSAKTLTGNVDTHPSLSDRLQALGESVTRFTRTPFPRPPSDSAAAMMLGQALPVVTRDVNLFWQKENSLSWQNVFHQARRTEKQLQSVAKPAAETIPADATESATVTELDADQLWRQAQAVNDLHGPKAAEPLLRELLARRPSHALANVTLGKQLLERGEVEGEQFLRRILAEDDNELVPVACHGLISYFQQSGQLDQIQETRSRLSRFETAQIAAAKERSTVKATDQFVPHGLSETQLESVVQTLAQETDLAKAWLVRKQLQHFPHQQLFVLVVQSKPGGLFGASDPDRDRTLVTRSMTRIKLPGRVLIIAPQASFRKLANKIAARADAQIFPASPIT